LITYMRTDSVRVSEEAIRECRSFIATHYGADLVNEETRRYRPSKQSQQAHEAIRPSYVAKTPDSLKSYLTHDQYKLYNIIWKRFMATQMKPAIWRSKAYEIEASQGTPELELEILSNQKKNRIVAVRILEALTPLSAGRPAGWPEAKDNQELIEQFISVLKKSREDEASAKKILELIGKNPEDKSALVKVISLINEPVENNLINEKMKVQKCIFGATESRLVFRGFLTLYQPAEELLPDIKEQNSFALNKLTPSQSFTEPPPHYTEASLVKILEKYGIGRPSTYAPIISTIEDRGYVNKNGRQLSPTDLGIMVNDKLVPFFEDIINTQFTARSEEELDLIEESQKDWVATLQEFYGPFIIDLQKAENEMVSEKNKQVEGPCPKCGKPIVERWSRFGKFLSCSAYPECKYTMSLQPKAAQTDTGLLCEKCGKPMVVKTNYRRSRFIACSGYPECKNAKPLPKEVAERIAPGKPAVAEKTEENESELSSEG
jgi:DNA topoisomerase I